MRQQHEVLNQCQHIAAAFADMREIFTPSVVDNGAFVFRSLRQDIDKADNSVQRRAKFMADMVKERQAISPGRRNSL